MSADDELVDYEEVGRCIGVTATVQQRREGNNFQNDRRRRERTTEAPFSPQLLFPLTIPRRHHNAI